MASLSNMCCIVKDYDATLNSKFYHHVHSKMTVKVSDTGLVARVRGDTKGERGARFVAVRRV